METTSCACVISICYLRDGALAEDAAQETFVRAWRSREDFRGASSEKTWLTSIAVNVCRNMLRSPWLFTALAAGPGIWSLIQEHLGPRAPYATGAAGAVRDQGIEFGAAAALADRNTVRVSPFGIWRESG